MNIEDAIAAAPYGESERLSPRIRRILAKNPSAFTYLGTGTYLVGTDQVAVIDPGPDDDAHLRSILEAVGEGEVSHILITHTHKDHSPLAVRLSEHTGAAVWGCAPLAIEDDGPRSDAAFDTSYAPDHVMEDGERVAGEGWTIEAVHTVDSMTRG